MIPTLWCDNEAIIKCVRGEGVARGFRHMELRMRYMRENIAMEV